MQKNSILQETIETLKKQHGAIHQATLQYKDKQRQEQTLTFVFRPPMVEEIERLQHTAQKSPTVANLELLKSIVVHNHQQDVVEALKDLPIVVSQFINTEVMPLLGELQNVETTSL